MVNLFKAETWKRFFMTHKLMIASGAILGGIGAYMYLRQIPREALIDITARQASLDSIIQLTPETKVIVAFILLGITASLIVSQIMDKR